ncbi:MAG: hypothetical protein ACLPXB_15455 [Thiobacillaceae bacterium]
MYVSTGTMIAALAVLGLLEIPMPAEAGDERPGALGTPEPEAHRRVAKIGTPASNIGLDGIKLDTRQENVLKALKADYPSFAELPVPLNSAPRAQNAAPIASPNLLAQNESVLVEGTSSSKLWFGVNGNEGDQDPAMENGTLANLISKFRREFGPERMTHPGTQYWYLDTLKQPTTGRRELLACSRPVLGWSLCASPKSRAIDLYFKWF